MNNTANRRPSWNVISIILRDYYSQCIIYFMHSPLKYGNYEHQVNRILLCSLVRESLFFLKQTVSRCFHILMGWHDVVRRHFSDHDDTCSSNELVAFIPGYRPVFVQQSPLPITENLICKCKNENWPKYFKESKDIASFPVPSETFVILEARRGEDFRGARGRLQDCKQACMQIDRSTLHVLTCSANTR